MYTPTLDAPADESQVHAPVLRSECMPEDLADLLPLPASDSAALAWAASPMLQAVLPVLVAMVGVATALA